MQKSHKYHDGELKCPKCGGNMKFDPYVRKQREEKNYLCYCDGLWFSAAGAPHRRGCKWCAHYKGEYTDEDYEYQRESAK